MEISKVLDVYNVITSMYERELVLFCYVGDSSVVCPNLAEIIEKESEQLPTIILTGEIMSNSAFMVLLRLVVSLGYVKIYQAIVLIIFIVLFFSSTI